MLVKKGKNDWSFHILQSLSFCLNSLAKAGLEGEWRTNLNHKPQMELFYIDFFNDNFCFEMYTSQPFPLHRVDPDSP